MPRSMPLLTALALLTAPTAWAETPSGDPDIGKAKFASQCVACHMVVTPEGERLAGRGSRSGPNLYGVAGRTSGVVEGFRYSKTLRQAGEDGLVWDEATFVAFVQDPVNYMKEVTGDKRARVKMAFKVRKPEDAVNIYAYLDSLAPKAE